MMMMKWIVAKNKCERVSSASFNVWKHLPCFVLVYRLCECLGKIIIQVSNGSY